jgi:hypothetical protein
MCIYIYIYIYMNKRLEFLPRKSGVDRELGAKFMMVVGGVSESSLSLSH